MTGKTKFIRNLYFLSLGTYVEYAVGLAIGVILARSLGAEQYGVFSLLMWVSTLCIVLINGGVTSSLTKFVSEACEKKDKALEGQVVRHLRMVQVISGGVILLLFSVVYELFGDQIVSADAVFLLYIILAATAFRAVYMFYIAVAQGREAFGRVAKALIMTSLIYLTAVVVAYLMNSELQGFVIAYAVSSFFYAVVMWAIVQKDERSLACGVLETELRDRIGRHVKYVKVNVVLSFLVVKQLEVFFLNIFAGNEDIAFFNVAFVLACSSMALVPGVVTSLLMPIMSRAVMSSDASVVINKLMGTTRLLVFMAVPVVVYGVVFAEDIVLLLYGTEYVASVLPLQMLLWVVALLTISNSAISYQFSTDKQDLVLKVTVISLLINVIADIYFISEYKLMGAVVGYTVSGVVMATLLFAATVKSLKKHFEYSVYLKFIFAGVIAALPIVLAKDTVPFLAYALPALLVYLLSYFLIAVFVKSWCRDDLEYISNSLEKKLGGRGKYVGKVFSSFVSYAYR